MAEYMEAKNIMVLKADIYLHSNRSTTLSIKKTWCLNTEKSLKFLFLETTEWIYHTHLLCLFDGKTHADAANTAITSDVFEDGGKNISIAEGRRA